MNNASALILHNNKILLFHRDNIPTIPQPDCWHLPGGGIEEGETPDQAIKRELTEEVTFVPPKLTLGIKKQWPDGRTTSVYIAFVDDNQAQLFKLGKTEGQEIGFFTINEALDMKLTTLMREYLLLLRSTIEKLMLRRTVDSMTVMKI